MRRRAIPAVVAMLVSFILSMSCARQYVFNERAGGRGEYNSFFGSKVDVVVSRSVPKDF